MKSQMELKPTMSMLNAAGQMAQDITESTDLHIELPELSAEWPISPTDSYASMPPLVNAESEVDSDVEILTLAHTNVKSPVLNAAPQILEITTPAAVDQTADTKQAAKSWWRWTSQ